MHSSNKNTTLGSIFPHASAYTPVTRKNKINPSPRHTFSTNWINQLRFLVGENNQPRTSVTEAPQIIVSGAFTGGGAPAQFPPPAYHFVGAQIFTWVHRQHLFKFGSDVPEISRRSDHDFTQ